MYDRILVRYGELTLKGRNKKMFVQRVNHLIEEKINNDNITYDKQHDRLYIILNNEDHKPIIQSLDKVSGLHGYSLIKKVPKELTAIKKEARKLVKEELNGAHKTFKVETKRADKTFPLTSMEISTQVAGYVLRGIKSLTVDVHNPELTLSIEVRRQQAFLYCNKLDGMGGFPVGVAGKGLLMLSGGIDSPVAGFLAMKQGIEVEAIHFESTPLTSIESAQKVIDLTKKIAKFAPGNTIRLHLVPFRKIHEELLNTIRDSYQITVMRRMMYRIAEKVAEQQKCLVLVNGESVGQVASQTLQSIASVNNVVKMPIIRPLATMDKQNIKHISKHIDTYETSIRPFEDCCTVYVPKSPTTKPRVFYCQKYESYMDVAGLVNDAVDHTVSINISSSSTLDLTLRGLNVVDSLAELEDET